MLTAGTIATVLLVGRVAAPFVPLVTQQVSFFQSQIVTRQMMAAMQPRVTVVNHYIYRCCCGGKRKHRS